MIILYHVKKTGVPYSAVKVYESVGYIPLVEFTYLALTHMPGDSCYRQFRFLLCPLLDVRCRWNAINSLCVLILTVSLCRLLAPSLPDGETHTHTEEEKKKKSHPRSHLPQLDLRL